MNESLNTIVGSRNSMGSGAILAKKSILLILSENEFGRTFIIDQPSVTVGRGTNSDFVINDPLISKEHFKVTCDDEDKYYIEDIDSKNGTFLNGKRITKKNRILYSDRIVAGTTILRFFHEEILENK